MTSVAGGEFVPDPTTVRILATLAEGSSFAETATRCNVSEATLRRKLAGARDGWRAETTIQLVTMAVRRGLI